MVEFAQKSRTGSLLEDFDFDADDKIIMISTVRSEESTGEQVKFVSVAPIIVKAEDSEDEEKYDAAPNTCSSL